MGLAGEKIMKIGEFVEWYMEAAGIKEGWRSALEEWISSLEGVVILFHKIFASLWNWVSDLEDAMVEESDAEGDVDPDSSSSSLDVELVENLVAIPVPAPSVIHSFISSWYAFSIH